MASRMSKYFNNTDDVPKRSEKNQKLYDEIYNEEDYSNIEGIATIDKNNEIDLAKLKNTIKNRENYSRQKKFKDLNDEPEDKPITTEDFKQKEQKIYDIRDVLLKAKDKKPEEDTPRRLDNTNYNILKDLEENGSKKDISKELEKETDELKELIDTITNTGMLNQLNDKELGMNMFNLSDDPENSGQSVKELLAQARKAQEKKENTLDNSFFTSSLNFSKDDFDDAQEAKKKKEKKGIIKKALLFTGLLLMTAAIVVGVYYLIK